MTEAQKTTVYFDGACPLCRREIFFYRSCKGASQIDWVDASKANEENFGPDLSRSQAMGQLYVRDKKNRLVSGGEAFTEIWHELSMFKLLAFVFRLPLMRSLLEGAYCLFLKIRPALHKVVLPPDHGRRVP